MTKNTVQNANITIINIAGENYSITDLTRHKSYA